MQIVPTLAASAAAMALAVLLHPQRASAHCDTMDGPTAQDGQTALDTRNPSVALKWVGPESASELSAVFERSLAARELGGAAREVADRWFLENLIRLHRAGEGVAFTGLKPTGTPVDERVAAADRSIADGDLRSLVGQVPSDRRPELTRRFATLLERQHYDIDDVDAGRAYIEAYVRFFKFAEGEDHDLPGTGTAHHHHEE